MSISVTLMAFKVGPGGESITNYPVENPEGMTETFWKMPECNLYVVCLAGRKGELREVKGGLAILTSLTHQEPEFLDILMMSVSNIEVLKSLATKSNMSFLPARITIEGEVLPSEDELNRVFYNQYVKYSSSRNA